MRQQSYHITQARLKLKNLLVSVLAIVFTIFTLAAPALATDVYDIANPNTEDVWVVDQAKEISLANQRKLSSTLQQLARETGQEVRMVAIRRLDYGETIDSFADEVFTNWYPNAEAKANQTLLVLDTLTNTVAIRTGENAQKLVDKDIANSIVEETVGYNLRSGNKYNQAFLDASDRLVAVLSGEEDPGPPAITDDIQIEGTFTKAEDTDAGSATVWVIVLLLLATVIPMVTYFWYVGFPGN
ncbi:MAG: TPM domain-containing protein [Xenococcaceae cyanobacterium MO_188.B32]|nr:TPM domain-containing protein [Xenococcaceae cyanobacterium MO_188.B32]